MSGQPKDGGGKRASGIGETVRTIVYALLIALVFRTMAFQPFSIPSGSMKPTLLEGDFLFVSKYAYGYSRHSIPFSPPLFEGRLFGRSPERGDIAVFKLPRDGRTDYIKRLVGLPGDRIRMAEGVLHVNGEPVQIEDAGEFEERPGQRGATRCLSTRRDREGRVCVKQLLVETLPEGVEHLILNADSNRSPGDNTREFVVPEGHYFFLGDNRDNSVDSRFASGVGFVPFENLVGRAEIIFLSSSGSAFAPWNWRLDRFFDRLT